jgi:hypothetical protein
LPHSHRREGALASRLAPLIAAATLAGCDGNGCAGGNDPEAATAVSGTGGSTYYVDAARGRDSDPGTSPRTAWRTLARVERGSFRGGDRILLRGGQRFRGSIHLTTTNLGATSRTAVLRIGSFGRGRATILAPRRTDGIGAYNVAGIRVSDINVVGRGNLSLVKDRYRGCRDGPAGIRLAAYSLHRTLDQGITVDHVDVSRFCDGLLVASEDDVSRIAHVRVTAMRSHHNGDAGVWTHDPARGEHLIEDVRVTNTRAYRNHDQGGIVLFGVDGGTVKNSVAFANAKGGDGGVGVWAFDSNRILFAQNESYRNGSAAITTDGDGFDFDRGVSNSVMEHNYSHDNGGVGFLVCSCERWTRFYRMHDIIIRSNVSRNDGSSGQPSLYVLGGEPMTDVEIVSNRIESGAGDGPLVEVDADHRRYGRLQFEGNRFVARGDKPLLRVQGPGRAKDLAFRGNNWRAMGQFSVEWGQRRLLTPHAWRAASGDWR